MTTSESALLLDDDEELELCGCPDCDEESGAGHGCSDNDGHLFCYVCTLAGCSDAESACVDPVLEEDPLA